MDFVTEVLRLAEKGYTDEEIADEMYCTSTAIQKTAEEKGFLDILTVEDNNDE